MPNKVKRSVKSTNPFKESVDLPGAGGVFGGSPAPGFSDYPETRGNVLPPTKFADTEIGTGVIKPNTLSRVTKPSIVEEMGLKKPGSITIIKGKNRYETNVKSNNTGKDKI